MKNLNENISRIKNLMSITEADDTQLDLFADKKDEPISITDDIFTKKFRDSVFNILKKLYQNTGNWSREGNRGPKGMGGVVNIYTIYDLMKERGLDDYNEEGGDWSILNYFDTNPVVRRTLVGLYEKENGEVVNNIRVMNDFLEWLKKNADRIFKEGPILKDLVKKNITSLYRGELNEKKAYDYLTNALEKMPNWEIQKRFLPGAKQDREGVDIVMKNNVNGKLAKFQVKPLGSYTQNNNKYLVKSYNISNIQYKPVDYFVFSSGEKEDVYVFKNIKDKYVVLDKDTIQFEYPPVKF
jgi:hypothetical protein